MNSQIPSLNLIDNPSDQFKKDIDIFLNSDASKLRSIFCDFDLHWEKNRSNEEERISKKFSFAKEDVSSIVSIGILIFSKLKSCEITLNALNDDIKKLGYENSIFSKIKEAYETYGIDFVEKLNQRTIFIEELFEGEDRLETIFYKVNYRAIYDPNKTKMLDIVPVVDLQLITQPSDIEKFARQKIRFQATENQLDEIIKYLNEAKKEFSVSSEYLKGLKSKR